MMLTQEKLNSIGFKKLGKNVSLSDKASIYSPHLIEIGDNTRIDDFCILSPGKYLKIGNHVHIACYVSLIGKEDIIIKDFSGISSKSAIYSSNDDYSGSFLTGPTIDSKFTNVQSAPVVIEKHVVIGSGTVILPGVTINEGSAVGCLSLITKNIPPWEIWAGTPAKFIKNRKKDLLNLEDVFLSRKK